MDYVKVLKLPQYFRNMQRLGEIVAVLVKHGFGDLVTRIQLNAYLRTKIELFMPPFGAESSSALDFSARMRLVFEELGPTFIKFAQIISTRPDLFPVAITHEFRRLQDKVPPFSTELAKERIEAELGRPIGEIFEEFEETPIGAASIAQVHRAKLVGGREVVVKVQRPNLDRILEVDTEILLGLATLIEEHIPESRQYSPFKLVEEFSRSLKLERDFLREAKSMQRFAETYADLPLLVIPRVYEEYTTTRVITEEFIAGERADSLPDERPGQRASGKAIVETLNRVVLHSIFETGFYHGDPHPGNVLLTADGRVALIDFGAMGRLDHSRSFEVIRFLLAIFGRDLDGLLKILRENQVAPRFLDEISLKNQVHELLDGYLGRSLGRINLAALLTDVFEVVRQYGIKPPPDLLLVAKSITSLQYIGAALDPDFDPVGSIRPYLVRRYASYLTDPALYVGAVAGLADSYRKLLTDFPDEFRTLLKILTRDEFTIVHEAKNFDEVRVHQNRMANRGIMAFMGVALMAVGGRLLEAASIHSSTGVALLVWGAVILLLTWLSVKRSGGT